MMSLNYNCEKHNRMILAVLNVDTDKEKGYCIGCIEELEKELTKESRARCDNEKCSHCDYLHNDEEE